MCRSRVQGAGCAPLTWGQQHIWKAMVDTDSSLGLGAVVPVTDGRTVEDFADELRFFMRPVPGACVPALRFGAGGGVTRAGGGRGSGEDHPGGAQTRRT